MHSQVYRNGLKPLISKVKICIRKRDWMASDIHITQLNIKLNFILHFYIHWVRCLFHCNTGTLRKLKLPLSCCFSVRQLRWNAKTRSRNMWGRVTSVYNEKTILETISDFPIIVYLHIIPAMISRRYVRSFRRDKFCLPPFQNTGQPEESGVKPMFCFLIRKWFIYLFIDKKMQIELIYHA